MSITINAQLFTRFESQLDALREDVDEGCMESIQKQTARLTKTLAEMRGTAGAAPVVEAPAKKVRKSKLNADGTEKVKRAGKPRDPNSPYMKLQAAVKVLYAGISAEDKKALTTLGFGYLKLCGYFNALGKIEPTEDDMVAAVVYLKAHPEYSSKTQVQRSASASQASASEQTEKKPRRQAKKAVDTAEAAPAVHVSDIVAQIEAHIAEEESDDESDDEEEENERVPLESWDWKGAHYLKDPFQEVYTAEGEMEWVGTFTGKKITKGDMPARVKAFIASQD
jgi:hypothetical protein